MDLFTSDLLTAIQECSHATQSNILRKLDKKYGYHATMFFGDAIKELEFSGKIVVMKRGGVKWWEID